MEFEQAFEEFGKSLGKLKEAYAEKRGENPNYLLIVINEENDIHIIPTNEYGEYIYSYRGWANTEQK